LIRIYGAGPSFAKSLLMQFNKSLSEGEAKQKADALFAQTKGNLFFLPSFVWL